MGTQSVTFFLGTRQLTEQSVGRFVIVYTFEAETKDLECEIDFS